MKRCQEPLSMTRGSTWPHGNLWVSFLNAQDEHPLGIRAWTPLEYQPLLLKSLTVLGGNAVEFPPSHVVN